MARGRTAASPAARPRSASKARAPASPSRARAEAPASAKKSAAKAPRGRTPSRAAAAAPASPAPRAASARKRAAAPSTPSTPSERVTAVASAAKAAAGRQLGGALAAVPSVPHEGLPLTVGLAAAIGWASYHMGHLTFLTPPALSALKVLPAAMIAWDALSRAKASKTRDRFANSVLVWLAAGVVQQVVSAVPQLSARLAPLLPFWALAATALLSYAFISQAPGAVSPDNAAPGVALFAALHGLPQLGGSTNKLVAAFVPKRLTVKALTKVGATWLSTLPAVFALARAVGAYRNPRASRAKPTMLALAALLLSPPVLNKLVAPLLAAAGVPKVLPADVTKEGLTWATLYLLDVATRA